MAGHLQGLPQQLCQCDVRVRKIRAGLAFLAASHKKQTVRTLLGNQCPGGTAFALTFDSNAFFAQTFAKVRFILATHDFKCGCTKLFVRQDFFSPSNKGFQLENTFFHRSNYSI